MAIGPRKRRTSSGSARFGGRSRASARRFEVAVTVKSYHVSNESDALEEDNYMTVETLADIRHFRDVYKAGTEFKVYMRPVAPDDKTLARKTIRSLQKKTAAAHSTGDALDPGSDIFLESVEVSSRGGETVLLAGYGKGLVHANQKFIALTDENGTVEQGEDENGALAPIQTLCGKTYANVPVMISPAVEYTTSNALGEQITRKRMSMRVFFPEQSHVLNSDADVYAQLKDILFAHVFDHPEEDVDWGSRGVEIFAFKKADSSLPKVDQISFYEDFDNAPLTYSLNVRPQRKESGHEGQRAEILPWSEDGAVEIEDALSYLQDAEYEAAQNMLAALNNPKDYYIAVVPAVTFRTQESLTPGYVYQDGGINPIDYPLIGTPLSADPVYNNGKGQVYNFPNTGGRARGVYHRCEYLASPGIVIISALPVTRSVQYYEDKPLNENNQLRREPYKVLKAAPFKILNYPYPAVVGCHIPLGAVRDEMEDRWRTLNLPRAATTFLEDLNIPGLPEALSEAHAQLRLMQSDIHYSYRIQKGYSSAPEGWPIDDGSGPDEQSFADEGEDKHGGVEGGNISTASSNQASSSTSSEVSWDAAEEDEIPF